MCTSYEAPGQMEFEAFSLFPKPSFEYRREIYKDYAAPIFRHIDDQLSTDAATFGMVPRERIPPGVKVFDTMNARAETVGQKRSFSGAWNRLQLALIPCHRFYEPSYETGKAVRWRIGLADGSACAIAGLWRAWDNLDGSQRLSMTMLTVNADEHPLMKRFHKPGVEKRGVVVLPQSEHVDWLSCRSTDEARSFLRLLTADALKAEPYPLPPRARTAPAPDQSDQPSLI
ncbi:SOS response-associated peptidase family protein [Paraburkholderia tuberum]|uniref:Abasic site processing protein n=1 Tax=Paraburkholderia tuberum TaxID=157910 RepID=A0A1H1KL04_9BURK|nr:SOS response-associated peptidase family protein [Paraburkholderia tuberum]SDR62954.1 Putative SOS response-associated peptidase YedK [Paraburkholderia tuberum]